jgi:two-component system CheB/CheR fusion protein
MQAPSVLIVEDHDDSSQFFASVARAEGHRVQTASSGAEALRMAEESWPDLILLDLALPGIDGWEVARRIRAVGQERSRPVIIAVTALSQKDCDDAVVAGCDDCLRKPVDPEILRSVFRWFKLWAPKVPPSSLLTGNDPATC